MSTKWEFIRWIFGDVVQSIDAKLAKILEQQQQILEHQEEMRVKIMAVKQTVEKHAADVNAFSSRIGASILGVKQDIAALKVALVDASTPEEVDAILAPAVAKLQAQAEALEALDAENVPAIPPDPPEEPPVEPPVEPPDPNPL